MTPKRITFHCSATRPEVPFRVEDLRRAHVEVNGWSDIGYHFYITTDGTLHACRPLSRQGAHVKGHNDDNVGVCIEGGLDNETGKPSNTFNAYQLATAQQLRKTLQDAHGIPDNELYGHRDHFGDTNGDGVEDSRDWLKECPCFDVSQYIKEGKL